MLERMHEVPCERLVLEEKNDEIFRHCNRELRLGLYSLPEGGTLIVNLQNVLYADQAYFYDTIATLQGMTGGPLQSKHLLALKPKPPVLQSLINAVDMASECFMYMDEAGVIRPMGEALNPTLLRVMKAILEADIEAKTLSPAEVQKKSGITNVQVCSDALKRLFNWGFINRKEESGNKGRPVIKYYAYWPVDQLWWPIDKISWAIPHPEDRTQEDQFFTQYPRVVKVMV